MEILNLNFLVVLASGLIPMIVGAVWYGPLFGKVWMEEAGMTMEKIQGANMAKIYGVATLFSLMFAFGIFPAMIHQMGTYSTLANLGVDTAGSETNLYFADFIAKYGGEFRTFKHGVLHGFLTGLFVLLPVLGTNALFERRSWKYILLNAGYWMVCAMLVGGVISAWA
jgi:hypothetical protein